MIKVVDLLFRCDDESGYTQALYCMNIAVLVQRLASRLDEICFHTTLYHHYLGDFRKVLCLRDIWSTLPPFP